MSDSMKRAERRENEIKHWERRLEREFNNNGRTYVDQGEKFNIKNCKTAIIPDDLKKYLSTDLTKEINKNPKLISNQIKILSIEEYN